MNLPTILILLLIALLLGLALWRIRKKGSCNCGGQSGCAGQCGHCPGCTPQPPAQKQG